MGATANGRDNIEIEASVERRATAWLQFRASENPLAGVRELHRALQEAAGRGKCPGLNVLFREAREEGTILGVPVLRAGVRLYVPREPIVHKVEGK